MSIEHRFTDYFYARYNCKYLTPFGKGRPLFSQCNLFSIDMFLQLRKTVSDT